MASNLYKPPRQDSRGFLGRMTGAMTGRVAETIDPNVVLEFVDVDALVERIDINRLLDRIDENRVLDRIDLNELLAHVDLNRILDRIDIDRLLLRADLNLVLKSIDVDALLRGVDLEAVVRRSGVPEVVAASTSHAAKSALDLGRRQLVGLDALLGRVVARLLRRDRRQLPDTPELLREQASARTRRTVTGRYAGAVTRTVAALLDVGILMATYALAHAGLKLLINVLFDASFTGWSGRVSTIALLLWAFVYVFTGLTITGRTVGKSIVGLRVVRKDGATLPVRSAFVRTLAFPLNTIAFGIGFLPVLLHHEHRALHDFIAGTAVVYDWGDRPAELPGPLATFLSHRKAWTDTEVAPDAPSRRPASTQVRAGVGGPE